MFSRAENPSRPALITGATGLLGSHIAEQLRHRNIPCRALCRPGSDRSFLDRMGIQVVAGDVTDRDSLRRSCQGIDTIYHAAARVSDWGPWKEFVQVSIEGTRNVLQAAAAARVRRFVHISSISVYGYLHGAGRTFDETAPLGTNIPTWSYYSRAKLEAEKLVWDWHARGELAVTVIRPSWLYGPRDRVTLRRLIDSIRRRRLRLIGNGENRLNVVHAGNVAEAVILAAQSDRAVGEAYNCSHDGVLTQRQYFNMIAKTIGEPEITARVPYSVAQSAAFAFECFRRAFRTKRPPFVTRYAVWLIGRQCFFECNKIREHLNWSSTVSYEDGIPAAVRDCLKHTTDPIHHPESRASESPKGSLE